MYQKPILLSYFMFILQSIKLIVNMGNVQIKENQRRSQPIFKNRQRLRSLSPFRQALSPQNPNYKKLSPIKYTPTNSYYKGTNSSSQKPQKKPGVLQDKPIFQRTNTNLLLSARDNGESGIENRWKCEQIIKKVRNFNDFLVHLKKKLSQNSAAKHGEAQFIKGEVSMNVKLQNQRIQLSKYKRLVERQLSKTHSIQQISIQNVSNGEKLLTIHYQNVNSSSQNLLKQNINPISFKDFNAQQTIPKYDITYEKEEKNQKNEEALKEKQNLRAQSKLLREAKALQSVLKSKCVQIHNQLLKHKKQEKVEISLQFLLKQKQKDIKISNLLQSLEEANKQSQYLQDKVRKLIS